MMEDDEAWLAKQLAPNKKNEAYWRDRLKDQGELKSTPPRSAWRRFMDNVEEGMRRGPASLIADVTAPLVETGDGKTYEERRKAYAAKEKQRRQDVDAVDPADSAGDYAADIAGGIVGSLVSDPTNLVNPGGGIGRQIIGNAAVGGLGDAALQGGEIAAGIRDEYDPIQGGINAVAGPALIAGTAAVKKGAKAIARPPKELGLDTAVGIGNKFGQVTSTKRTPEHNKRVGGAKNSHHLQGTAIDIARGKGVTHKQIERAYRRAGYDIIESLDEGDHSHLAFNFRGSKAPVEQGPDDLGEVRLVQNQLPPVEEMRRVNNALAPQEQEMADDILRQAEDPYAFEQKPFIQDDRVEGGWRDESELERFKRRREEEEFQKNNPGGGTWYIDDTDLQRFHEDMDPIADQAPLIDSYHERFTPYVDEPNAPANQAEDSFETINFDLNRLKELKEKGELPLYDFAEELKKLKSRENLLKGIDDTGIEDVRDIRAKQALETNRKSLEAFANRTQEVHNLARQGQFPVSLEDVKKNIGLMAPEKVGHLPPELRQRAAELKSQWEDVQARMTQSKDVLTPAERQEMDASVPSAPSVDPTVPKALGGGRSGDPANDVVDNNIDLNKVDEDLNKAIDEWNQENATPENVADFPWNKTKEGRDLNKFHKELMGDLKDRARKIQELGQAYHEEGKLPYKIGTKFTTEHGRSRGEEPWEVIGYSVDPKDPDKYGYHVQRGNKGTGDDDPNNTYERSVMSRSNPKFDEKMKNDPSYKERTGKDWVPLSERTDWQVVGKPKLGIVKTLKDIIDDEEGAFRPFGRDPVTNERVPFEQLEPEARLNQLLKRIKPMTGEQRKLYRQERAKRGSSLGNLQRDNFSVDNFKQQASALRGQLPKTEYESIAKFFSEEDITALGNKINHSPTLLPYERFNASTALMNLLGAESTKLPTPGQIKLLSEVYSDDFIKTLLDNRTFMQKAWHTTKSVLNIPRAIMSSMDFSAPFRQGIGLVHKKEWRKAWPHMFKMWSSEDASKDWHKMVKNHPRWEYVKRAGLSIVDPHSHFLADREEEFMTDLAEKIPLGAGNMISRSNRAYSGFLNKLRWDTFNNLVDQMENMGEAVSDKQLKQLGKFVNMATGRGDLGKNGNKAAPALSALLFSPRLIASRLQTFASPITYARADPLVRKEAWKSLMSMSAYYATLGGIAKYGLGMDVETDTRSPDFMKAKIGNTRYDFMAGYGQYIRLFSQLISDSTITAKGEEKALTSNPDYKADTRRDVLIRFFLNKLAPIPSLASDYLEGSDPTGKPFTWKSAIASRMLPMASQDIADAIAEWGQVGGPMGLPGLFGWSVQTYDADKPKDKPVKEETIGSDDAWLKSQMEGSGSSSDDKWLKEQGL